ncbi:MAG TPA: tetrahydromethanopterin S-methyltransferase subunit C [Methanoculleus sp.]|nr:tetrahydromethanopterin S-methyltransferase subunit C [Methanoculleus sp.]
MSVKIEASEGGMPHDKMLGIGVVGALVCLYIVYLNSLMSTDVFAFFGGLAAVIALWWGTDSIKTLCSYGLGTGVPSAGMISLGSGVIAFLFATKLAGISPLLVPLGCIIIAAIIGAILGFISDKVLNMNIPVMTRMIAELTIVGSLTMLGFTAMISGSFIFTDLIAGSVSFLGMVVTSYAASVIGGCILATIFMLGAIAIQHPFNACLGPNESWDRTQMCALECGFLSMLVVAVMSVAFLSLFAVVISFVISIILWGWSYSEYIKLSKRDAYAWLDSKPIREVGGE